MWVCGTGEWISELVLRVTCTQAARCWMRCAQTTRRCAAAGWLRCIPARVLVKGRPEMGLQWERCILEKRKQHPQKVPILPDRGGCRAGLGRTVCVCTRHRRCLPVLYIAPDMSGLAAGATQLLVQQAPPRPENHDSPLLFERPDVPGMRISEGCTGKCAAMARCMPHSAAAKSRRRLNCLGRGDLMLSQSARIELTGGRRWRIITCGERRASAGWALRRERRRSGAPSSASWPCMSRRLVSRLDCEQALSHGGSRTASLERPV
jgi:hypothetical protein